MRIAVLSGKGGTGKTFVSVNLAYANGKSTYIDCDVEEPNGRLFLKPGKTKLEKVNVMVPYVEADKCIGCRKCAEFCKFNALAYIKNKLLVFRELCHSCKGCVLICPQKALTEGKREIGSIEQGVSGDINIVTGELNVGEATGVPIIRKLLEDLPQDEPVIVDCPPGSSCAVMESIKDADYCLLVAEPTVFGIHNLDMVNNLVKLFNKPHAIVLNKTIGDRRLIDKYCIDNDLKIIGTIPYDKEIGLANSRGSIVSAENSRYMELFIDILAYIEKEVEYETTGNFKRQGRYW